VTSRHSSLARHGALDVVPQVRYRMLTATKNLSVNGNP
jgi:hypothetical protein